MGLLATAVIAFIIRKEEKYNDDNAQTMIKNLQKTQAIFWKRGLPSWRNNKFNSMKKYQLEDSEQIIKTRVCLINTINEDEGWKS